jgi:thiamine biosynthesis protein ThiS
MKVFVNDAPQELTEGTSLATLLKQLDLLENKGWAFAVNGSVVKKNSLEDTILANGDKILLIQATQGG